MLNIRFSTAFNEEAERAFIEMGGQLNRHSNSAATLDHANF
ncbi:hypothetical protein N9B46_01890 [Mariniblastus sp.]|nr:hypothetical protein [Mariniblastus sp.]